MAETERAAALTDARCVCCDLPLDQCGVATAVAQAQERRAQIDRALQHPGVFAARYPGVCATCQERFDRGDPIAFREGAFASALCCPELVLT